MVDLCSCLHDWFDEGNDLYNDLVQAVVLAQDLKGHSMTDEMTYLEQVGLPEDQVERQTAQVLFSWAQLKTGQRGKGIQTLQQMIDNSTKVGGFALALIALDHFDLGEFEQGKQVLATGRAKVEWDSMLQIVNLLVTLPNDKLSLKKLVDFPSVHLLAKRRILKLLNPTS